MATRYVAQFKIEFLSSRFRGLAEEELRGAMRGIGFSKLDSHWFGETDLYPDELRQCIRLTIFPNLGLSSHQSVVDLIMRNAQRTDGL
jgi:hypothetical protein